MMRQKQEQDWQVPPFTASPMERMAWVDDMVGEAESWLRGQAAYQDIPTALAIIAGKKADDDTDEELNTNFAKYAMRKIIATLSEIREIGTYTSNAKFFKNNVEFMNQVSRAVYLESKFPRQVRGALQYMAATGCGYIWPKFKRGNYGMDKDGKIVFDYYGLLDVLPVQLPQDNSLQGAYVVTVLESAPVAEAHSRFPAFQSSLLPIARRRYTSQVSNRRLDLWERFKYGEQSENWEKFYCEIRYTFIRDVAINTTGMVLPMGDKGSSWYYEVPYVGMPIPDGMSQGGVVKTRKAKADDCRIYPQLRLIISSKGMRQPMYDGPAFDWHGQIPPIRYCSDDWPWEPCGFSLVHDIATPERARQTLERYIVKIAKARLNPSLGYDRTAGVGDTTAGTLDIFDHNTRLGVDGDPEKVLRSLVPPELMNIPEWEFKFLEHLLTTENQLLGLADIMNFAKMKMNINNTDSLDKLLEFDGPLVKDIAFGMECSTGLIAEQLRYMIPQWLTTKRLMQYVGPDNITPETLDFDPESLVPSHGADELSEAGEKVIIPNTSIYTKMQRAKLFAENLRLVTVPHTMHEMTQMQEQLKYLQLFRSGAPIGFVDVAKKLNITNYGEIEGATIRERWINEQKQLLELKAQAAQLAQSLMPEIGGGGPQEPGTGPKGGQKGSGGRAPSGQKAPRIKQKGQSSGNPRTTVSESG